MQYITFRIYLFITFLFLCFSAEAITYSWNTQVAGSLSYTNGNMVVTISNTNFDTRGPRDPNGGANNGYKSPKYVNAATINTYQGGFTNDYGMPGLVLGVDWTNLTSTTTVDIVFTVPVAGPATFSIYDINLGSFGGNTPTFVDRLTISGTNCSGGAIYPTKTGCGSSTSGASNNIFTGVLGCTNTTNTFTITSPTIKSIRIVYASSSPLAAGYGNDPDPQYIIISDITTGDPTNVTVSPNAGIGCGSSTATLSASSNIAGATFAWSGPAPATTPAGTTPNSSSTTVSSGGTYTVVATDPATGCTISASAVVNQSAAPPTASIAPPATLTCSVTSVTLTASSTTAGVTYAWSGGGTGATKPATTAGIYTVTVTDPSNGCTASASVNVVQSGNIPNVSIAPPAALTCSVTSVTLTASSTTAGVTYAWSGGGTGATKPATTAGIYNVTVTDPSNGCTASASVNVVQSGNIPNVSIAPPAALTCSVTSVTLTASSTTAGVTYAWNGGGTGATRTATTAGTYTITVTDPSNGCTASASVNVVQSGNIPNVSIAPPAALTCSVTSVTLTASSTTAGVTYAWSGGGTGATKPATTAGIYTVTVTDPSNGCTASASVNVSQSGNLPSIVFAPYGELTCTANSISINASSPTPNATFDWGGGNTSPTYTVRAPGSYTVTVTDPSSGCQASASTTVSQNTVAPNVAIVPPAQLNCAITIVTLSASSTTSGVGYNWAGGVSGSSNTVSAAGNYAVTVTDPANGCTATAGTSVSENIVAPSATATSSGNLDCSTTSVVLTATSNATGANFLWSTGGNDSTELVSNPNNYTVTVTNLANGCTASASVLVTQSGGISVTIPAVASLTCTNRTVLIDAVSGTTGLVYIWSNGSTGNPVSVTSAGIYTVTAIDRWGACSATASITISESITNPVVNINTPVAISSTNPSVTLSASSNTTGSYVWSNGGTSPSTTVNIAGTYSVTFTEAASGCSALASVVVEAITDHNIFIPNSFTPNGDGNNDVFSAYGNLDQIRFFEIQVFNRWGEKVFESNDHHFAWDGTYKGVKQNPQVFVWVLSVNFAGGTTDMIRKGSVTLLR